jgi:hypothetical protein
MLCVLLVGLVTQNKLIKCMEKAISNYCLFIDSSILITGLFVNLKCCVTLLYGVHHNPSLVLLTRDANKRGCERADTGSS